MKLNIAENIRKFRKERGMTQERLAEITGVTVGAVSKWESGASVPEIGMLTELAELFRVSVDVLLGYSLASGAAADALSELCALRNEKSFDKAALTAERAIERYPNSFDVVFQSAVMYSLMGMENKNDKAYRRALALFERSLELVGQNTDSRLGEGTIRAYIARTHISLRQYDEGLEQLKRHNAGGVNNAEIGLILAGAMKKPDEALTRLAEALAEEVNRLVMIARGYACAYELKRDFAAARDVQAWLVLVLEGLRIPGKISYIDRLIAQFAASEAVCEYSLGDTGAARAALCKARKSAERFDSAPDYSFSGMRFFHSENSAVGFDDFGKTAADGVRAALEKQDKQGEGLLKMWDETA